MTGGRKAEILVIAKVPADLRTALAADFELVDYDRLLHHGSGARIALTTSMAGANCAVMDALPGLALIACQGAGLDRIDLDAAAARGIRVAYTPDVVTDDTADLAVALIYAVSRRIVEADKFVRAGRWPNERIASSRRVSGKVAGIVGLGRIGGTIAQRLSGLGLSVLYSGPNKKDVGYRFVPSVLDLAAESDFLILSCPGDQSTVNMVDTAILKRLGPKGVLINVSRGSVVAEEDLIQALTDGTIAGAGLDVFRSEPNIDERFLSMSNVVLQPHAAAITEESRMAMISRIRADIDAFLAGRGFTDAAAAKPMRAPAPATDQNP